MAVSLIPKFNRNDIKAALLQRREVIDQAILLRLKQVGEMFVKNAREKGDYQDDTGNLRSSIGYVIIKNGTQLFENFQATSNGPEGVNEAKGVIENAIQNLPNGGYILIGVAGMSYAAAVESRGFDVISASANIAATSLKIALQKIQQKLK